MRLHRRRVLVSAIAAASLPGRETAHDVDVAIGGAGAAGLAAALRMHRQRHMVDVIEPHSGKDRGCAVVNSR